MSHKKPKARAKRCEACPHPPHPKGVCTVTTRRSGNRGWQCGCAAGMRHRVSGKPHYVPVR